MERGQTRDARWHVLMNAKGQMLLLLLSRLLLLLLRYSQSWLVGVEVGEEGVGVAAPVVADPSSAGFGP